jgi:heterodisulfide reductase subunit A
VGNIIVAIGFKIFDAARIEHFGYGKFMNVLTSLEFERLVNAAGPTGGYICSRTVDKKGNRIFSPETDEPKSVALIHCVGSRDENYNKYCSKVCCMYSLKLAHLIKEKLPDAEVYEYFIDMRAFGKGYEEFYERIKREKVHLIRGRTAKIEEVNGQLLLRSEDILNNSLIEHKVDMVILAVGLEPSEDALKISEMLGIPLSEDGWFKEANYNSDPVNTIAGGVFIAGVCQGPKDIPDTVAQASAAASRVLQVILKGKIARGIKDIPLEKIEARVKELSTI